MLVLTRKQNDEIIVDGQITIRVLEIKGNRIRIGIDAPRSTPIRRGELAPLADAEKSPLKLFVQRNAPGP